MDHEIRWGILGCGDVTEVKSGPAFQKACGSRLVAVMRRNAALAEDYAERHGVPKWYANADALIDDEEVTAVYIATPPGAHLELALKVCAAGKPAYVEKPMARNHAECQEMVRAFEAAKLPLFVAYYRRSLPRFTLVKEILERQGLGIVTGIRYLQSGPRHLHCEPVVPWRLRREVSGGGLFVDVGSHTLDLLDYLFGPLAVIGGDAVNRATAVEVEDNTAVLFQTPGGVLGTGVWNFATNLQEDRMEIFGTDGSLTFSVFGNEPVHLHRPSQPIALFDRPNPPHIQQPLIQAVVDELLGQGKAPSTGQSAARTSAVMDTVLQGFYEPLISSGQ